MSKGILELRNGKGETLVTKFIALENLDKFIDELLADRATILSISRNKTAVNAHITSGRRPFSLIYKVRDIPFNPKFKVNLTWIKTQLTKVR